MISLLVRPETLGNVKGLGRTSQAQVATMKCREKETDFSFPLRSHPGQEQQDCLRGIRR